MKSIEIPFPIGQKNQLSLPKIHKALTPCVCACQNNLSCATTLPQKISHWCFSQNLWLSSAATVLSSVWRLIQLFSATGLNRKLSVCHSFPIPCLWQFKLTWKFIGQHRIPIMTSNFHWRSEVTVRSTFTMAIFKLLLGNNIATKQYCVLLSSNNIATKDWQYYLLSLTWPLEEAT